MTASLPINHPVSQIHMKLRGPEHLPSQPGRLLLIRFSCILVFTFAFLIHPPRRINQMSIHLMSLDVLLCAPKTTSWLIASNRALSPSPVHPWAPRSRSGGGSVSITKVRSTWRDIVVYMRRVRIHKSSIALSGWADILGWVGRSLVAVRVREISRVRGRCIRGRCLRHLLLLL